MVNKHCKVAVVSSVIQNMLRKLFALIVLQSALRSVEHKERFLSTYTEIPLPFQAPVMQARKFMTF